MQNNGNSLLHDTEAGNGCADEHEDHSQQVRVFTVKLG